MGPSATCLIDYYGVVLTDNVCMVLMEEAAGTLADFIHSR
jgi:hypothetical protein